MKRTLLTGALVVCHACYRSPIALPASAQSGANVTDVLVGVRPSASDSVSLARFEPDLPPVNGSFECSAGERLSPNVRAVYAAFPTVANSRATVVVMMDSTGKLIRYAERRGAPIRPTIAPGLTPAATAAAVAAAADSARSTTITLDLSRARAAIANRGGGRPAQSVSEPLIVVVSLDKFGKPLDRAQRVLAQCDSKR
jgi:hypothetical protein